MNTPGKVGFISLGCAKATVDSERILTELRIRGYEMSADYATSDLVIVNTCGFIDAAVEESLQAIGEAIDENGKVIVTGCLGTKAKMIKQAYPNVLAVTGPNDIQPILEVVQEHLPAQHDPYIDLVPPGGIKLTPRHYAYLKISEGCNHRCSFCIIPHMRGDLASRPASAVMLEAEALVSAGVKELLVVSQDTSAYGVDIKYQSDFYNGKNGPKPIRSHVQQLSEALGQLGIWIRLHYVYPYPHVDNLVLLMTEGLILPYLDVPFQHASPSILKAMKRPAHSEKTLQRILKWREICPELTIRSTFIVGFPGETDQDFSALLYFLDQAQIDRAGCFKYSDVEGALANSLPGQVSASEKQDRFNAFMAHQAHISQNKLKRKVGTIQSVMVDSVDAVNAIGRTRGDAPEVDGIVEIKNLCPGVVPGQIIEVRISDSHDYDLIGEQV